MTGDRVSFRYTSGCAGAVAMTASNEGDRITWSDAEGLPPYNTPEYRLDWQAFAAVPWIKVADISPAESEFPEGTYRMEITAGFLMAAGVDRPTAVEHAGTWTLTFKAGQFQEGTCLGTYSVQDDRLEIVLGSKCGDASSGVLFSAGWTLEDDQLQFTDVRSGHGSDLLVVTLFGGQPFTKIG